MVKEDPAYNPEKTAARIRTVTGHIVSAIEKNLSERKANDNRPLFVPVGEQHDLPAHTLCLMNVIESLRRKDYKITLGLELRCDTLTRCYVQTSRPALIAPETILYLREKGNDTGLSLKASTLTAYPYARYSRGLLAHYVSKTGITARLNDAARTHDELIDIDPYDPENRAVLKEELSNAYDNPELRGTYRAVLNGKDRLSGRSNRGMQLRDKIMARRALALAGEQNADIHIQHCGANHIRQTKDRPNNLHTYLKQKTPHVLPFSLAPEYGLKRLLIDGFREYFNMQARGTVINDRHSIYYSGKLTDAQQAMLGDEANWLGAVMSNLDLDTGLITGLSDYKKEAAVTLAPIFKKAIGYDTRYTKYKMIDNLTKNFADHIKTFPEIKNL